MIKMNNKNNMLCDIETGVCGVPENESKMELIDFNKPTEVIDLYYVTDPICSHCWALEPVLGKFLEQYGHYFKLHTVMGGLLEGWDGFADVSNGIGKPSDVAGHWREVGEHSRMPIDGSVWLDNPIQSSYPPSRVFKVIQQIDKELAITFLRRIREAVFVFNQNIAQDETLIEVVNQLNLNGKEIVEEAASSSAQQLLNQDFELARSLGVRGFPTIIMINGENKGVKTVGVRELNDYVNGLKQVLTTNKPIEPKQPTNISNQLTKEFRLFSKEIEVMYDISQNEVSKFLEQELPSNAYEMKRILGEVYIEKK
jgi:putative protein-disulfide isomerase